MFSSFEDFYKTLIEPDQINDFILSYFSLYLDLIIMKNMLLKQADQ